MKGIENPKSKLLFATTGVRKCDDSETIWQWLAVWFFMLIKSGLGRFFQLKKDAKAYEGKIKASNQGKPLFRCQTGFPFEIFKELSKWYLSLEGTVKRKNLLRGMKGLPRKAWSSFCKNSHQKYHSISYQRICHQAVKYQNLSRWECQTSYCNRELGSSQTIFNKAIRDGKLEKNPVKGGQASQRK